MICKDSLDGRHAPVRLLCELASDVATGAFRAACGLGGIALGDSLALFCMLTVSATYFDLSLSTRITAWVLPPLPVGSFGVV